MTLEEVRADFAARFYEWAQRDSLRELEQGFPLLSRVRGRWAKGYLAFVRSLSAARKRAFVLAMVNETNGWAVGEMEASSEESRELIRRFRSTVRPSGSVSHPRPDGKLVWSHLKEQMRRVGIGRFGSLGGMHSCYRLPLGGDWEAVTWSGGGVRPYYFQAVWAAGEVPIAKDIGIYRWMGIAGSPTTWDELVAGEEADAAWSMSAIAQHFVTALPELLRDLSCNLPVAGNVGREMVSQVSMRPRLIKQKNRP